MVEIFIDTEFNGFGGELISMALVPNDGSDYWYEVLECKITDPWVIKNVKPHLIKTPLRPLIFKSSFQNYIKKYKNPTIIADWFTEPIYFCELMSGKDYSTSLAMEFEIKVIHGADTANLSKLPHNALADAQALRGWYNENRS